MFGSIVLNFNGGWACSNDASLVVERDLIKTENGMVSKHTNTLRIMGLHLVKGTISKTDVVNCVFKNEETGLLQGFEGTVVGLTNEMTIIKITKSTENYKEIIKNIKGGYNYGK